MRPLNVWSYVYVVCWQIINLHALNLVYKTTTKTTTKLLYAETNQHSFQLCCNNKILKLRKKETRQKRINLKTSLWKSKWKRKRNSQTTSYHTDSFKKPHATEWSTKWLWFLVNFEQLMLLLFLLAVGVASLLLSPPFLLAFLVVCFKHAFCMCSCRYLYLTSFKHFSFQ